MQHDNNEPGAPGAATTPQDDPAAADAGAGFDMGPDQLKQIIAALQEENDKLRAGQEAEKDQALRLRAEIDNMRKRTEREKLDTAKYAISKFAGDIVNVADNFERALKSVPQDALADNPTLKALQDGVAMTEREFLKVLEKHGVRRIDPTGEPFNPHQHQAVMEQENAEVANGTVLQVFQSGYIIEDRVLRPAMVVVSRGGAKAVKPSEQAAPSPANDDRPGDTAANGDGAGI
jgi:molecular chaperone GrpE